MEDNRLIAKHRAGALTDYEVIQVFREREVDRYGFPSVRETPARTEPIDVSDETFDEAEVLMTRLTTGALGGFFVATDGGICLQAKWTSQAGVEIIGVASLEPRHP